METKRRSVTSRWPPNADPTGPHTGGGAVSLPGGLCVESSLLPLPLSRPPRNIQPRLVPRQHRIKRASDPAPSKPQPPPRFLSPPRALSAWQAARPTRAETRPGGCPALAATTASHRVQGKPHISPLGFLEKLPILPPAYVSPQDTSSLTTTGPLHLLF